MRPPEAFIDEYWRMREHMKWAEAGLGRGQDVAQAKTVLEGFRQFFHKWYPVIKIPDLRRGMEEVRERLENGLGRGLERIFLTHLREVIEARKDWWIGEQLLKASVSFIGLMKHAPPQMRPELEKIHREHVGKDFDPTTHYQEAEAETATNEADFRNVLANLEVDWPERVDAALRERLEHLDGGGANAWQGEVAAQLAALEG